MEQYKIHDRIKRSRKYLGYTQEYMAQKLGISLNSYRAIEIGKTILVSNRLIEIATILGTSPEQLFSDRDSVDGYSELLNQKEQEIGELKNRLDKLQFKYDVTVAEKDGKISELISIISSKDSIIGVLKEKSPHY